MARILIVDDDELLRLTMREMLEDNGHDVFEAGDGTVGLAHLKKEPVDLVITDLIMPGKMEGIETIFELQSEFPGLPVIAMSGKRIGGETCLGSAQALGARASLQKPFTQAELLKTVVAALGG